MDMPADTVYHVLNPDMSSVNASFVDMAKPYFNTANDEVVVETDPATGKRSHVVKRNVANLKEYYMTYSDWEPEEWTQYFITNNAVRFHKITDEAGNVLMDWTAFPNLKGQAMKDWI